MYHLCSLGFIVRVIGFIVRAIGFIVRAIGFIVRVIGFIVRVHCSFIPTKNSCCPAKNITTLILGTCYPSGFISILLRGDRCLIIFFIISITEKYLKEKY